MPDASVNIHEAKTHLSRLIERVETGLEIVIARAGRPVARLIPYRANDTAAAGSMAGSGSDRPGLRSDRRRDPGRLRVVIRCSTRTQSCGGSPMIRRSTGSHDRQSRIP
jgi:prevent-host-death family protein